MYKKTLLHNSRCQRASHYKSHKMQRCITAVQRALKTCTELLLRCCCPYLNNSSPVFPHLAINEDPEDEEEDEDQDYSFPISSILEW